MFVRHSPRSDLESGAPLPLRVASLGRPWSVFVEGRNPGDSALPPRLCLSRRSFSSSNISLVDIVGASLRVFSIAYANWCLHGCADFVSLARSQFGRSDRELSVTPSLYLSKQCTKSVSPLLSWARQAGTPR
jgi:hypothetical protein